MGKRKGVGVELELDSDTLTKIQELWGCFSEASGLEFSQLEGIMYNIAFDEDTKTTKFKYVLAERLTSNKKGLGFSEIRNMLNGIKDKTSLEVGYSIVNIPENGWTYKKINATSHEYTRDICEKGTKFRIERFNKNMNTIAIKSTAFINR